MVKHNSPKAPGLGSSKKQALKPVHKKLSKQASIFCEAHACLYIESSSWARGPKNQAHSTSNPLEVVGVDVFFLFKQTKPGQSRWQDKRASSLSSSAGLKMELELLLRKDFAKKIWNEKMVGRVFLLHFVRRSRSAKRNSEFR